MKDIFEKIAESRKTGAIEFSITERKNGLRHQHHAGTVQAGAMLWLADVTATVLALQNVELGPDGKGFPLAINLNTSLLGNQRNGKIRAEARFVRSGKRVTVIRTRVTGTRGQLLAEVTTTHVPAT